MPLESLLGGGFENSIYTLVGVFLECVVFALTIPWSHLPWIVLACRLARGTDQVLRHSCLRVKAQTGVEAYEQAAQS